MYAIVRTGGKQYKAEVGKFIDVEKLDVQVGDEVSFEALMVVDENGSRIGTPVLTDVTVKGKVLAQDKAKKILVFKYKPKKDYRRRQGHRQPYTRVEITSIGE